jgi:hypothetical protein
MQQFTQIQKRSICGGIACVVSKKCKAWHLVIFHVLPGHDCAFPDHHLRMWDLKLNEMVPIPIQASLTNLQRKKLTAHTLAPDLHQAQIRPADPIPPLRQCPWHAIP